MPQQWNPQSYRRDGGFVAKLGEPLLDLLAPGAGEKILDLGCGNGELSAAIAARGAKVIGVDSSPGFVDATHNRGIEAQVMDGQALKFDAEFDAVFSNAALHWMTDPDAVLRGIRKALKPGGRFVAEMGGKGNVDSVRQALRAQLAQRGIDAEQFDPWFFPGEEYRARLEDHGFVVDELTLFERPTEIATDIRNWLELFGGNFLDAVPALERDDVLAAVRSAVEPQLLDDDGIWRVDYVRLRFAAHLPS